MICSDSKKSYLSDPQDRKNLKSLSGLCEPCGTQYQYSGFLRSFRRAVLVTFFSIQFLVLLYLGHTWSLLLVLLVLLLLTYGIFHNLLKSGEKVRFKNNQARDKATRFQRFTGYILGSAIPIILMFIIYV